MSKYKKITIRNLWVDEDFEGISYTDGFNVEQHLLASLKSANDLSALSEELIPHIIDWPSEYHFSRNRHCLLRPLGIKQGDRVLELGCGCGALTRYLGETGADVVSVEGGLKRAEIAAERCRDLKNVNVVCQNLLSFSLEDLNFLSEKKFDLVLLIGVIEYAPVFSDAESPIKSYLDKAGTFLKESGKLIIAIENKIGLKYLNGCTEDHMGEHFYGLNDLYDSKSAVTFGRKELVDQLGLSGFTHAVFYYPFPDYKLPTTILKDEAFDLEYFDESQLLLRTESRDYIGKKISCFLIPWFRKFFPKTAF
jgi:SAM-dependent methyltransferase